MATVDEWVRNAEEDRASAALFKRRRLRLYNSICFHCQQCAEEYLKAYLQRNGIVPPHTHDLQQLNYLCQSVDAEFGTRHIRAASLTPFAVQFRYPGSDATAADVFECMHNMNRIRRLVRAKLGP